jgi:hypothetical protein
MESIKFALLSMILKLAEASLFQRAKYHQSNTREPFQIHPKHAHFIARSAASDGIVPRGGGKFSKANNLLCS